MAYYNPVDNLNNQGFVSTAHLGKRKLVHGGAMSRMWIRVSTPPTWDVQLELGINGSFNPICPICKRVLQQNDDSLHKTS